MNLVKQQKLHYKDEKSDKVYEVEMFHLQNDEYIVNFRYGRRGNRLTEGTKTVFPATKTVAEKVFDDLVNSKVKKGYHKVQSYNEEVPIAPTTKAESPAKATVLKYLKQHAAGEIPKTNWKLSRIIWRAGELKIAEAVIPVGSMLHRLKVQERYAAIWLLGRISNKESHEILSKNELPEPAIDHYICKAALIKCKDQKSLASLKNDLPLDFKNLYESKKFVGFTDQLNAYLFKRQTEQVDLLWNAYLLSINNPPLKTLLLEVLKNVPLVPNYWKYIRYIFKASEMIEDAEVFALLASSIQKADSHHSSPEWGNSIWHSGKKYNLPTEYQKSNSGLAFSNRTKKYFTRRIVRRLKQAGEDGQELYCAIGAEILSYYSESDRINHPNLYTYEYNPETRRYTNIIRKYHNLAHVPFIYYLLFSKGNRLEISGINKFMYAGEAVEQTVDEAAHIDLWNKYPKYAAKLLVKGRIKEATNFAMSILKDQANLKDLFSNDDLVAMVQHPFPEVLNFAIDLIRSKYNSSDPNTELIIELIRSDKNVAIDLAIELINQNQDPFIANAEFVKAAIITSNEPLQNWVQTNISESSFTKEENNSIIDHVLKFYQSLEDEKVSSKSVDSFVHCFKDNLAELQMDYILALLDSEKFQLQLLAGKLININNTAPADLPGDIMYRMIASPHEAIRAQGTELLSKLSDKELIKKEDFLVGMATCDQHDLRIKAGDLIGRLSKIEKEFKDSVFLKLYPHLMENHEEEEFSPDVWTIIETHLSDCLPLVMPNIEAVLKDDHRETHLLAAQLIDKHSDLAKWPVEHIALLGNHDMKYLREVAYKYYEGNVSRMKYETEASIKLFNTEWTETNDFACQYFDTNFTEKEWEPALIINLCDNVRPEVQDYGTRVLGKFFKEEHGIKYLTDLSEHPDATIQLYTTNYLDRYAFNNMDMLVKLKPYFKRILGAINVKSVAKQRVYAFLEKQAMEGEVYGRFVADLLQDFIGTIAILDKQRCALMLYKIENKYKEMSNRIERVPIEIRNK